jgi:hypothetical protein
LTDALRPVFAGLGHPLPEKLRASCGWPSNWSTRLLKAECEECGYTVRVTKKWLEAKGAPICPCNMKPMVADVPEAPEEQEPEDGEGERIAA